MMLPFRYFRFINTNLEGAYETGCRSVVDGWHLRGVAMHGVEAWTASSAGIVYGRRLVCLARRAISVDAG